MLLGIICNRKKHIVDELQSVTHMYLEGVAEYMNVQPVLIPSPMSNGRFDAAPILDRVDGILVPGSTSNVHPSRYDMAETEAHKPFDTARDEAAFQTIGQAIVRDIPVLAICRGFQELNVICGGSLNPTVHELDGRLDHRMPESEEKDEKFKKKQTFFLSRLLSLVLSTLSSLSSELFFSFEKKKKKTLKKKTKKKKEKTKKKKNHKTTHLFVSNHTF